MKYLIVTLFLTMVMSTTVLFDFNDEMSIQQWQIEDDVVMGGRSDGNFRLDDSGYGVFEGEVSLENNGGFSSLINRHERISVTEGRWKTLSVSGKV